MKFVRRFTVIQEQAIEIDPKDKELGFFSIMLKYQDQISKTPFKEKETIDHDIFFLE